MFSEYGSPQCCYYHACSTKCVACAYKPLSSLHKAGLAHTFSCCFARCKCSHDSKQKCVTLTLTASAAGEESTPVMHSQILNACSRCRLRLRWWGQLKAPLAACRGPGRCWWSRSIALRPSLPPWMPPMSSCKTSQANTRGSLMCMAAPRGCCALSRGTALGTSLCYTVERPCFSSCAFMWCRSAASTLCQPLSRPGWASWCLHGLKVQAKRQMH